MTLPPRSAPGDRRERNGLLREAQAPHRRAEQRGHAFGERPLAAEAHVVARVVALAAACIAYAAHDLGPAIRDVPLEPRFEEIRHAVGQSQEHVGGGLRPGPAFGLEDDP